MQLLNTFALIFVKISLAYNIKTAKDGERTDFEFVYNYTKYLHGVYNFKSFVIFSHEEARWRPNFVILRSLEQALSVGFNVPIIICGREKTAKLRHIIGLDSMVFVQFNSMKDSILSAVDHTMEGLHFITFLFFYKTRNNMPPTAAEIRKFFKWCWLRNMINVALTFQIITPATPKQPATYIQNQVYTYTPFPKLTVYNLTKEVASGKGEYTTDRIKNVKGYAFKTPVFKHLPYTFLVANDSRCKGREYCGDSLSGIGGHVYKEFVKHINGTIKIVLYRNSIDIDIANEVLMAAANKKADIVPHPFLEEISSYDSSAGSYPIAQTNFCIIVPVVREMQRQQYLFRAFQMETWYFVLLTFVILFGLEVCFSAKTFKLGMQCLSYALIATLNFLVGESNVVTTVRTGGRFFKIFHFMLPFMAFFLTNMYAASLKSLLSTAPYGIQIDTVAQLMAADLEIMTTAAERTLFFETNLLPAELIPKLRIVDSEVMAQQLIKLNDSFAFLATAEEFTLLNSQQQHLSKPLIRTPGRELCTSQFFLRFPVQWDSPFKHSLDIFFMVSQERGLSLKWRDISAYQAKRLKLINEIQKDIDRWTPLHVEHFLFAFYLICSLWFVSMISFCLEVIWFFGLSEYFEQLKSQILSHFKHIKRQMTQF